LGFSGSNFTSTDLPLRDSFFRPSPAARHPVFHAPTLFSSFVGADPPQSVLVPRVVSFFAFIFHVRPQCGFEGVLFLCARLQTSSFCCSLSCFLRDCRKFFVHWPFRFELRRWKLPQIWFISFLRHSRWKCTLVLSCLLRA